MSDIRYALRSLWSRPLVTAVAVLSLALGIGVNTAIFSVFDRLFLRRLAVPQADGLVLVTSPGPRPISISTGDGGGVEAIFSYPLFRDLEGLGPRALTLAGHRDFSANLRSRGQTFEGEGLHVSGRYFPVLNLTPALGRLLGPEDDRVPGGHSVAVLSHDYWTTRFGADPDVIGEALTVNGEPMTIVGVAPAGFSGTTTLDSPHVFVPLGMAGQVRGPNSLTARDNHWVYVFGRLAPGVSREQAEALVNVPFAGLIREVELPAISHHLSDRAREQFEQRRLVLEDGSRERNSGRAEVQPILLLLFAVTGFVLAIACANVANLLLARTTDRAREISVRLSMGATPGRLLRLLLIEACLLGALGGVGALAVGLMTLDGLLVLMPAEDRAMLDFGIDGTVLPFTFALGLGTSLLFGLFPALHGVRHATVAGLHLQSTRTAGSRSARRFRTSMATAQVALATSLLAVAGLFVVSLASLGRLELGIQREGLVAFRVSPYLNGYDTPRALSLFDRLEGELRGLPDVTAISASTVPVLANSRWLNDVTVEGFEAGPDADRTASWAEVGTDYFRTLGIALLAGREFTAADTAGSPRVAVVNEAFARKFNLEARVIGTRLALGAGTGVTPDIEIVGLVRDATYSSVRDEAPPQFFLPYRQADGVGSLTFYVRTTSDTRPIAAVIPSVVERLDATLPVGNLRTLDEQIWQNTTAQRVLSTLSSAFAGLATLLAAVGLYAVLAYGVAQRRREFGIRIALGATGGVVRRLVLARVGRITLVGGTIGVALAFGLGRLGEALLFGVEGSHAAIIGGALLAVCTVALGTGLLPARRAALVNPVEALRAE